MDSYTENIENLAKTKDTIIFKNSGADHAAAVISRIFKYADKEVRLFVYDMDGAINKKGDYLQNLTDFLKKGKKISVLFEDKPKKDTEVFELLSRPEYTEQIQLKKANEAFLRDCKKISVDEFKFTLGDDRMFRIENDSNKHTAFCSFNNDVYPKILIDIFDKHFSECQNIN